MDRQFYLEGFVGGAALPRRFDLTVFPVTVGRHENALLRLNIDRISRQHARIDYDEEGQLTLTDLGSTNGSFVNHQRIQSSIAIHPGDILHFANHEFRLMEAQQEVEPEASDKTMISVSPLSSNFPTQLREFNELLEQELVCGFCQPIFDASGKLHAYELLGRGAHPALGNSPYDMFKIAQAIDKEVELSELLRRRSFIEAEAAGLQAPLFFNIHPRECHNPERLLNGLDQLRRRHSSLSLVLEIHEAAVTDLKVMAEIHHTLKRMGIGLAYDDFGAGQARLLELAEVPPDVLKFDIALVSGAGDRSAPKFQLLAALNKLVKDMGIPTLAEGVETEDVANACRDIGIDYFQGYLYGKPGPIVQGN